MLYLNKIKIAIVGIGNCASSLIQGIHYYDGKKPEDAIGLMHWDIGGYEPSDIEVSYSIKGFATVPTSKDLISGNPKAAKYVSSELNDMLEALEATSKVEDYFKLAQEYKNQLEREQSKLIRKIWMHKMSALVGSNFNSYSDGLKWESVPTRKKGAVGFASTEVDGLQLALISINMA